MFYIFYENPRKPRAKWCVSSGPEGERRPNFWHPYRNRPVTKASGDERRFGSARKRGMEQGKGDVTDVRREKKGVGLQWVQFAPGNWVAPAGSYRGCQATLILTPSHLY